jgi:hypothetical protein
MMGDGKETEGSPSDRLVGCHGRERCSGCVPIRSHDHDPEHALVHEVEPPPPTRRRTTAPTASRNSSNGHIAMPQTKGGQKGGERKRKGKVQVNESGFGNLMHEMKPACVLAFLKPLAF